MNYVPDLAQDYEPVQTLPSETTVNGYMSVRDMIKRFNAGQPLDGQPPFYTSDVEENGIDLSAIQHMDRFELMEFRDKIVSTIDNARKEHFEASKLLQEQEDKARIEAAAEALLLKRESEKQDT